QDVKLRDHGAIVRRRDHRGLRGLGIGELGAACNREQRDERAAECNNPQVRRTAQTHRPPMDGVGIEPENYSRTPEAAQPRDERRANAPGYNPGARPASSPQSSVLPSARSLAVDLSPR